VLLLGAMLLTACNDPNLSGLDDDTVSDDDDSTAPPTEECNGVDDDGDGLVDEGFADLDEDGVADCVDASCTVETPPIGSVASDPLCTAMKPAAANPWDVTIEWQWTELSSDPSYNQSVGHMAVGPTRDTNGDGVVGRGDDVHIAAVVHDWDTYSGPVVLLDGATGAEVWVTADVDYYLTGGLLLADLDGDARPEIVAIARSGPNSRFVRALDGETGGVLWESEQLQSLDWFPMVTIANLDNTGGPELLVANQILDAATGTLIASIPHTYAGFSSYTPGTLADIDLDGEIEVIIREVVWSLSSGIELTLPLHDLSSFRWGIAQLDSDPEPELIMPSFEELTVFEHDGTLRNHWTHLGSPPGVPCIADFDGDARPEVIHTGTTTRNFDLDSGLAHWTVPTADWSTAAGCSAFDFDLDGAYDVAYADENTFYLVNGATGVVEWSWEDHVSGTAFEYPIIADIDGDESAEIIFGSYETDTSFGFGGITVLGHATNDWPNAGPSWGTHDYAPGALNLDGTLPATPNLYWQTDNLFRARPAEPVRVPDLTATITDACWSACEAPGEARFVVQVANRGAKGVPTALPVALYALEGETETLLQVQTVPAGLAPGAQSAGIEFSVDPTLLGPGGVRARVDDDGFGGQVAVECDEGNNEAVWLTTPCK